MMFPNLIRPTPLVEIDGSGALQPPRTAMIGKASVLIIDDELPNIRLLERILKRANCRQCIGTTDPREALALFEKHQPDLILTDWLMPYQDGCAVIEQIHAAIGGMITCRSWC